MTQGDLLPRPRKDTARNTRALAVAACHDLLHEHGYLGFSLKDVAQRISVRQASLYHHFPAGKEELVVEVALQAIERDAIGVEKAVAGHASVRERLTALASFALNSSVRTGHMLQVNMRHLAEEHQRRIYGAFYQRQYLPVRQLIQHGVDTGELKSLPPHHIERAAWAFLDLVEQLGMNPEEQHPEELAPWIVNVLLDGVAR